MDGKYGVELADTNQPDLVLLDIQIPEMDGYEVLKRLKTKQHFDQIPIIAITAHAMKGDKEHIKNVGFDDYIAKPIDTIHFLKMVDDYLNESK